MLRFPINHFTLSYLLFRTLSLSFHDKPINLESVRESVSVDEIHKICNFTYLFEQLYPARYQPKIFNSYKIRQYIRMTQMYHENFTTVIFEVSVNWNFSKVMREWRLFYSEKCGLSKTTVKKLRRPLLATILLMTIQTRESRTQIKRLTSIEYW